MSMTVPVPENQQAVENATPTGPTPATLTASDQHKLTGPQKAAIIIALLGPEDAEPLVNRIEDQHLKTFIEAYENMKMIPREILNVAVNEFIDDMQITAESLKGGQKEARTLAEQMLDENRAARIFGNAPVMEEQSDDASNTVWLELAKRRSIEIADFLESQRPQMIAIILSNLAPDKAGEILAEIDDEISEATVTHLMAPPQVDRVTMSAISKVLETQFLSKKPDTDGQGDPLKQVAEIFSVLPSERREALMGHIASKNPDQADEVKKGIVTFEDIPDRLPRNAVPIIFREMDQEILMKALKYGMFTQPVTIEFLFGNISQRMAQQYDEDLGAMKDVPQKEGEGAQSAVMGFITRLEKQGRVKLTKGSMSTEE